MLGFEVFDKKAAPSGKEPWVTMQRRGNFSLNAKAVELLGKPEAVELLYNRDEKLVGFRSATLGAPRAYPLRRQGESGACMIAGRAFTQNYKIATAEARRFKPEIKEGAIIIDLKGDFAVATGPRLKDGQGN